MLFSELYIFLYDILGLLKTWWVDIIEFLNTQVNLFDWNFTILEMLFGSGFLIVMGWLLISKVFIE